MKENKFINSVVDSLVNDTKIDHEKGKVIFPFWSELRYPIKDMKPEKLSYYQSFGITDTFYSYSQNIYGLSGKEIDIVWDRYMDIIYDMCNTINERTIIRKILVEDRKEQFLDKVLQRLLDETKFNYNEGVIDFPFDNRGFKNPFSTYLSTIQKTLFIRYVQDSYGLTDDELEMIYQRYKTYVQFVVEQHKKNINESSDKQSNFFNGIVDDLLSISTIKSRDFIEFNGHQVGTMYLKEVVFKYLIELYGITNMKEGQYIWNQYVKRIS